MYAIKNRSVWTSAFALLLATLTLSAPAVAQRYKAIQPKMTVRASKGLKIEVDKAMDKFDATGQGKVQQYFRTFYFPMMTQVSPDALARLGTLRDNLFKRFLRDGKDPAAQAFLTKETLGIMGVIARDNYHPAVRFNAVLIMGLLEKQYNQAQPTPLPAATNELLELLEKEEFNGVKVPPQVKVAALQGLQRHVQQNIDPQAAARVTKAALSVIAQKPDAMDVPTDVHHWIKCQAAAVLIEQTKSSPSPEVQAVLNQLVSDDSIAVDERCHLVGMLKKMQFAGTADDLKLDELVVPIGKLTQAAVDQGAEEATEFIDAIIGNNPSGRGGNFGGGRRGEEGPEIERTRLLSRLRLIVRGAGSLSAGLPDEEQQKLTELIQTIAPVAKLAGNKKEPAIGVAEKVVLLKDAIDLLVNTWQPAAPAAEAAVDFAQ